MAGRTPKPTPLKRGKRAVNPAEPKPMLLDKRKAMAAAREFLISAEAKRLWPYLYEPLREARLATEADLFALLELAESIGEMREARLQAQAIEARIQALQGGDLMVQTIQIDWVYVNTRYLIRCGFLL